MAPIKTLSPAQDNWTKEETIEVSKSTLASMLTEMKELKAKVWKIEERDETGMKTVKDVYDWPLSASYRLWAGKPILSSKSVKGVEWYDYRYKDQKGEEVINHYIELELADGTTIEWKNKIPLIMYWKAYERSKPIPFWLRLTDWSELKTVTKRQLQDAQWRMDKFIFNTEEYGVIEVSPDDIN